MTTLEVRSASEHVPAQPVASSACLPAALLLEALAEPRAWNWASASACFTRGAPFEPIA